MSFQPQSNERPHRHRSPGSDNGYGLEKDQSAPSSSSEGGLSKVLMIGLVVLALIASVVTVMTDSEGWMKIAILAALWAAFIGVFLVVRYSSALKNEREQRSLREGEHRAELEREKSRAREELARAESDFAQRAKATRDEQIELLRAEVENLRNQLEGMGAGDLGDNGPRAVRARAERIVELENRGSRQARPANPRPAEPQTARPQSAQSQQGRFQQAGQNAAQQEPPQAQRQRRNSGGFSTGSFAAVKWTGQDTEATAQIPLVVDTSTMNPKAEEDRTGSVGHAAHASDRVGSHDPNHRPAHAGPSNSAQMPSFRAGSANASNVSSASKVANNDAAPQQDTPDANPPAGAEDAGYRPGRRRADEGGLTVAELLQRAKNKQR